MAKFSHVVRLSKEEVDQAILALALAKKPSGVGIDAHTFHTKAKVEILSEGINANTSGAEITWEDE